jgi:sec-independent protein translocase protein TatB
MFEVGFTEIILILGLALLVLGPEKLPALAEKVGRWTGRARAMARQLRSQLEHEVTLDELSRSRPAQASTQTPASTETSGGTTPESGPPASASTISESATAPDASAAESQAHGGPGLDLDKMVSGLDSQPAATEAPKPAP